METSSMFFTDEEPMDRFPESSRVEDLHCLNVSEYGYSELWRCRIEGKFHALKALKKELRGVPMYESLLKKEFELGYDLDHPAICSIIDFRRIPELGNCIVMQWVDGETLSSMMPSLDKELSRKIMLELCDALEYIHSRQIVHRDLKPDNILITHNGHNVKLIDFGLSDADDYAVLKFPAGTIHYAAPELRSGGAADCRSDIYSLGMIMSEMPGADGRVVRKCTNLDPGRRYRNISEVRNALTRKAVPAWSIAPLAMALAAVIVLAWLYGMNEKRPSFQERTFRNVTQQILDADS